LQAVGCAHKRKKEEALLSVEDLVQMVLGPSTLIMMDAPRHIAAPWSQQSPLPRKGWVVVMSPMTATADHLGSGKVGHWRLAGK
jgi:hypothetical protein